MKTPMLNKMFDFYTQKTCSAAYI